MLENMKKCFELYFGSLYKFWYISVYRYIIKEVRSKNLLIKSNAKSKLLYLILN